MNTTSNSVRLSRARTIVGETVDFLVANGTSRERLLKAAKCFTALNRADMEPFTNLQKQFDEIRSHFSTKQDPIYGAYDASVRSMSSQKMRYVCQALLDLDRAIREA